MSAAKQHVILCEGYDDRSFWKGWLLHLGCIDPSRGGRSVSDAFGREVKGGGRFLFRTPAGSDVIVQPFHGRDRAKLAVEDYLGGKEPEMSRRVLLNLDLDAADALSTSADDQVRGIAQALGATSKSPGSYEIGGSRLYPIIWKCEDPPAPGLPERQTLERLVVASICSAYPARGPAVDTWLKVQPRGLFLPRSFSHSYYAKWYADHGAGDFYELLWRDPAVAAELGQRLAATGSRAVVEELVQD